MFTLCSLDPSHDKVRRSLYSLSIQDWQIRMYGGSGPGGGGERGGERRGSPDTEETDVSGDERFQCRGSSGFPTGAINPLMIVRGQGRWITTEEPLGMDCPL